MTTFNLKQFLRFTKQALFQIGDKEYPITSKRLALLAGFYAAFPFIELGRWTGSALDDLLFPEHRETEIREPVFIVGNPRSGTTFLQRLLAQDKDTFTSMQLWEMLIAPSVTQRRFLRSLSEADHALGSPIHRTIEAVERRWHEEDVAHKVSLRAPEEDQYLFVHIWSTLAVWNFSAMIEGTRPYIYFDTVLPEDEKERHMTFYKRCIQQHLHAHNRDERRPLHYLSKNPSASPKLDTLYRYFPDAKVIYLVRNPLDMIPSFISILDYTWDVMGTPTADRLSQDYVLTIASHWYRYPLQRLDKAPENSYVIVNYNDLTQDAERTVQGVYDRLGLEMTPTYAAILKEESEKARNYKSKHKYSLEGLGLSREAIVDAYRDVFDRFGFDTREPEHERVKAGV